MLDTNWTISQPCVDTVQTISGAEDYSAAVCLACGDTCAGTTFCQPGTSLATEQAFPAHLAKWTFGICRYVCHFTIMGTS